MSIISKLSLVLQGSLLKLDFDKLTHNPRINQRKLLLEILQTNKNTEYGKKHNFAEIKNEKDYSKYAPIVSYQTIEPFINKITAGAKNVLTSDSPIMFNMTSGTTDKPKLIPVTARTKKETSRLQLLWLYNVLKKHRDFLKGHNLIITSSAIEGFCDCGLPCGSLSGQIYENLPRYVMKHYALPLYISQIQDYELRYYIMVRLAIEKDMSLISSPNPSTLLKISKTLEQYSNKIIKAVANGVLFYDCDFTVNDNDELLVKKLTPLLQANSYKADILTEIFQRNNKLKPKDCWPELKLIACWLGGSSGDQIAILREHYGDVPIRDIGIFATEAVMTLPYQDNTAAGILALTNNYYEFIPESDEVTAFSPVLLANELEIGKNYRIILTTRSGLYRYDIDDIIRVEAFYNKTPVISFISKGSDFINITGEKVHLHQWQLVFEAIKKELGLKIDKFRIVTDNKNYRHEIYASFETQISKEINKEKIVSFIDHKLSKINIEYQQKRTSKRLNKPLLHIMRNSWPEAVRKELVESGKRDVQYKWVAISSDFIDIDKKYIQDTVKPKGL